MTLREFFQEYPDTAIAFSGGVDSAYLLYAGMKYGRRVRAYYVQSPFQPAFELEDARRLARELGAEMTVLPLDVLSVEHVKENPGNRCYYCKKAIFGGILKAAKADGFSILLDGTNASDDTDDRPGMRAIQELRVLSPLRICGLTKDQIRALSKEAELFTWDKPSYACLATRIPAGETITLEKLSATEDAEGCLAALGFRDFRVRTQAGSARIQVRQEQMALALSRREEILSALKPFYKTVSLDLEARS